MRVFKNQNQKVCPDVFYKIVRYVIIKCNVSITIYYNLNCNVLCYNLDYFVDYNINWRIRTYIETKIVR